MVKNKFYALWLALICIVIFIAQTLISGFTDLFLLNNQALGVEFYRFITAIFLHGSLSHLVFNLFALIFFGLILEKFIGSKKFLIVFFISGVLANIFSVFFYPSSLGASGAIFGIIGCLTILKPLMTVWAYALPLPLFLASILWMIGDVFGVFFPENTANLAHLIGVFVGLIFGIIYREKNPDYIYERKIHIPEDYMRKWEDNYLR